MPRISAFFGITVRMYYDEHNPPHLLESSRGMGQFWISKETS